MVLGSGPTADDIQKQEPLSGYMGSEMRATLDEAGIKRADIMVIHAYACRAAEPKRKKDERAATNACRGLVMQSVAHLSEFTPTLLAGSWALLSATGTEKGLFKTRGFTDRVWTLRKFGLFAKEETHETQETPDNKPTSVLV